jgi:hypothetical protein
MSSPLDDSDFVDRDFLASQSGASAAATLPSGAGVNATPGLPPGRPPNREELEARLTERHQQLAELRRRQEAIERERVALEEARRRQAEFETGRPEIIQHLTRGIELLELAEFRARREAEQMAKSLAGLREALTQVQAIRGEAWTPENWQTELTRALTTIENARMEWNSARLKWSLLNGQSPDSASGPASEVGGSVLGLPPGAGLGQWFKLGFALTWPVAVVGLLAAGLLMAVLLR